ncbi:hypothetical protein GCM10007939_00720 [Amylibacter marinus]|uniref:Flp pilus assembly protein TadD, contains TPR repeats n=1 Tax=Amylibacter marinus TaxID=1475483 RepID=A0ABQ5VR13_9RHOB|nr:hypothetical protein [Amylibacter marinus]GLQ33789.1 hypothetical protein GCM10007939_00720 [Amylibacter marinus]
MRRHLTIGALLVSAIGLAACDVDTKESDQKKLVGVVDETNLNEIMLNAADPNEAVSFFKNSLQKDPERVDLQRYLALSLIRAKRAPEANVVFAQLDQANKLTDQDRVEYAGSLIRASEWKDARAQLNRIPPTVETFQRYRFEAMVADSQKQWKKADSFYETASNLTTQPAGVLNNWGYSKLTRGDAKGAERLFTEAITFDKTMFTAKNNLVLARASRQIYDLPVVPMTQIEQAELTYTMALAAIKNGRTDRGRGLLEKAIELHPRHFEAAVNSLKGLRG